MATLARSPLLSPVLLTAFPQAVKVTIPDVPASGVHNVVNVAGSPALGAVWVASDQLLKPVTTCVPADPAAVPPTANVPCWLLRRLKPARPGLPFTVVTVNVSVICWPVVIDWLLDVSTTIGMLTLSVWHLLQPMARLLENSALGAPSEWAATVRPAAASAE